MEIFTEVFVAREVSKISRMQKSKYQGTIARKRA